MSAPNLLSCQQETGWQDSEMTSANRMERKCHHQKRKLKQKCQGEKDVQTSSKHETLSRFKDDKRKPKTQRQHQTKMSRIQKCQGQRLPRDHAVGRASQVVRLPSYRLSFVFIGSSLYRNFRHPACPGSTCITTHNHGSKKRYGSLRGDPDVWNEGITHMISNEFYPKGHESGVWIACASGYRSGPYILSYRFCKWNVHTSCVWLVAIIAIIQLLLLLLRMGPLEVPGDVKCMTKTCNKYIQLR